MIHTATIEVQQQSKSPTGGVVVGWSAVTSNFPCRFDNLKADLAKIMYGDFDSTKLYRIYSAINPNVNVDDRFVYDGSNFRVLSILNMGGDLNRLFACDCERKPTGET